MLRQMTELPVMSAAEPCSIRFAGRRFTAGLAVMALPGWFLQFSLNSSSDTDCPHGWQQETLNFSFLKDIKLSTYSSIQNQLTLSE
jgi:hypothetical protein